MTCFPVQMASHLQTELLHRVTQQKLQGVFCLLYVWICYSLCLLCILRYICYMLKVMNDNPNCWQKWYLVDQTLATVVEFTGSHVNFAQNFSNFWKWITLLRVKTRYAGNPRKMPETVPSGEDSFASRFSRRIYWLGGQPQFSWSQNGVDCIS